MGWGLGLVESIRAEDLQAHHPLCTLVLIFCVCDVEMVTAPKTPCELDAWSREKA